MVATGITARDRVVAGIGTAVVLALFGYMLVRGLTVGMTFRVEQPLALLDLRAPPPPPPRRPPPERPKPKRAAAPSPPNFRSKAVPIVVPPPIVPPVAPPPPLVVARQPGIGTDASAGASNRAGPGEGAGGEGDGTGSGGEGDGGGDTAPRQIKGHLSFSDLPADLRAAGISGTVGVRYHVETDGHVTGCVASQSSGHAELDSLTCHLIEQRFRFAPSRDGQGNPVRSIIVETHSWDVDRSGYSDP
jgi:protein TonB